MRILCASWHYPPSSEICGKVAYRFARALAARGHSVTVVTVPPSAAVVVDPAYGADVPGVRVVRVAPWPELITGAARWARRVSLAGSQANTASGSPSAAPTLRSHLRNLRDIPDRANIWIMPARAALRLLVREERPDLLLTHSPFLSAHIAGLGIRRVFPELPWWAWLHDPITLNPFDTALRTLRQRCLARWEAAIAREASGMCLATNAMAESVRHSYHCKTMVLRSGYDPDDWSEVGEPPGTGPLVLIHAGTLYGHRTPLPLLEAMAGLRRSGRLGEHDLRLHLVGDATYVVGERPELAIRRLGLEGMATVEPAMSQAAAHARIAGSHVGVVLAENQVAQVPAKLFEYVGIHRPVLALADGETGALVRRHGIGFVATRTSLADVLLDLVTAFRADRLRSVVDQVIRAAPLFSMSAQAEVFERSVGAEVSRVAR